MYNSSDIADKVKIIAKSKNIPMKKLLEDVGLGFNTMSNMKTSMPKVDNIAKIADYLDVSVDYLLGRTDEQTTTYHANNVSSSFVQNDSAVTLGSVSVASAFHNNSSDISSSKEETEILNIYRSLDARDRTKFMNFVFDMEDKATKA